MKLLIKVALLANFLVCEARRGIDCTPTANNNFHFRVNFHTSGLLGEYEVEGCEGTSPTLTIIRGVTYTLIQENITNWMHPLGLAYYPDGAHGYEHFDEVPELEYPTPDTCKEEQFQCNPGDEVKQAPLYGIDGVFETFEDWNNGETGGLDVYEPSFKVPQEQWSEHKYAVKFTVPLDSKTGELFYFCHIHSGMSGMIRVVDSLDYKEDKNELVQKFNPDIYYSQHTDFDQTCGTSGVAKFHHAKDFYCPNMNFLCDNNHNPVFSMCMEAIDCKMNSEMRVEEHPNPLVVFMHQMIPHHKNAVNMARIALKHSLESEGYNDPEVDVPALLRDIINKQNMQIQDMESWLERYGHERPRFCQQNQQTESNYDNYHPIAGSNHRIPVPSLQASSGNSVLSSQNVLVHLLSMISLLFLIQTL